MRKFLVLLCAVSLSCVMAGCSGDKVTDVSSVPKNTDTKVESMSYSDFGEGSWVLHDSQGAYGSTYVPSGEQSRVGGLQVLEDGSVALMVGEYETHVGGNVGAVFISDAAYNNEWKRVDMTESGRFPLGDYVKDGYGNFAVGIVSPSGEFCREIITKDKPEVEVLNKDLNLVKIQIGDGAVILYNCGYAIYSEEK